MKICRTGKITVICGPMSSGKSEQLIRLIKRHKIAGRKVEIFKHCLDSRDSGSIKSRSGAQADGIRVVSHSDSIKYQVIEWCKDRNCPDVIAIDEAQFLDSDIIQVVNLLVDIGIDVIVAGLEKDRDGIPFGSMPGLMAVADYVEKLHAVCMKCKRDEATFSYLHHPSGVEMNQIVVGGDEKYEARCRNCWHEGRDIKVELKNLLVLKD